MKEKTQLEEFMIKSVSFTAKIELGAVKSWSQYKENLRSDEAVSNSLKMFLDYIVWWYISFKIVLFGI